MSDSTKESAEQREFREHCRAWLNENRPAKPSFRLPLTPLEVMTEEQRVYLADWQNKCHAAGLIGSDYPKEYGGGGHVGFQRIANQELSAARVPFFLNVIGLGMAAPTILHHGTEEQKRKFLPPLLSGDEIWCQGFSEPNAGSDLANQHTSAKRKGESWIINGHKVWTTLAHFASWMIIICRTDNDHKYQGLTYFIAPIANAEGVKVRPLIKMTGETGFNEVFFDDVEIPDSYRLDEVGKGWTVAMTTLLHERGAAESAGSGGSGHGERIRKLVRLAKNSQLNGKPAWEDSHIRDRIMRLAVRAEAADQAPRFARIAGLNEQNLRVPLQSKLVNSELSQETSALGCEIAGAYSTLYLDDTNAPDSAQWPLGYMNSFGFTIAAGTSEIQRNILGERILGMAKTK